LRKLLQLFAFKEGMYDTQISALLSSPTVSDCTQRLGRVDEFEVFPTKSVGYRKTDFSLNASKINGLLLIRPHALVQRFVSLC